VSIYLSEDDRRRLVPLALVQVLTVLIDELEEYPDFKRAALRAIRSQLCRVYRIPDPMAPANSSEVAQGVAEEDGDAVQE